jgi:uncharacterized protein Usg
MRPLYPTGLLHALTMVVLYRKLLQGADMAHIIDRSFVKQLENYRITTAEILYWLPDHRHVLQSYIWQELDVAPGFPKLTDFCGFWERAIEGKIHRVRVANADLIKPATYRFPAYGGVLLLN